MIKLSRRQFAASALGGLAVTALPVTAKAQTVPVKIVLNRNTSNLVGFIAVDQGLFKKHGLDVDLTVGSSGAESNELLASGRVDGGTLGLGPSVISWAIGLKLVPVVKYRDGAEVYSIIARNDSGINSIADLAGKRVAVTKGTDPETAFILALRAHGIEYSEVNVLDVRWADQPALLDRGDIDAANANEPFGSIMLKTMGDKVKLVERLGDYYGDGGLMLLSEEFVNANPNAAKAMALAYWEGHQIIREQPEIAIASLKKWLNLDDETAKTTRDLFGARPLLTEQTIEDLKTNADILSEGDRIRSVPDIDAWMSKGIALQNELLANPENKALVD